MVSPIGIKCPKPESEMTDQEKLRRAARRPPFFILKTFEFMWSKKISPFEVMRFLGKGRAIKFINNFVDNRYLTYSGHES